MPRERTHAAADLSLLAITAVWGFTFPAVKRALEAADPFSFLAARFALAAVVVAVVFRRRALRANARTIGLSAFVGVWLTAGYALQTVGLVYTTASKSAFITGLFVVLVPVLSLAVSRTRPGLTSIAAVALASAGIYLLASPTRGAVNIGDVLTIGCALAFALHIVVAERVAPRLDAVQLAFWQIATTAALCLVFSLVSPERRLPFTAWTVTALLVTGVMATAVAFVVQMWAQQRTSATHVAVIFAGEPLFAALFSWLVQGEVLSGLRMVGGALILGGILLSQLRPRARAVGHEELAGEMR
ncbi:MAG: DMT family transporter [Armatimonadota bacterium]